MADMYFDVALIGRWAILTDREGRTALATHRITPDRFTFTVEEWFDDRTTAYGVAYNLHVQDQENQERKRQRNEERERIEEAEVVRPPDSVTGEGGGGLPLGPWDGGAVVRWLRATLAGRTGLHREDGAGFRPTGPD